MHLASVMHIGTEAQALVPPPTLGQLQTTSSLCSLTVPNVPASYFYNHLLDRRERLKGSTLPTGCAAAAEGLQCGRGQVVTSVRPEEEGSAGVSDKGNRGSNGQPKRPYCSSGMPERGGAGARRSPPGHPLVETHMWSGARQVCVIKYVKCCILVSGEKMKKEKMKESGTRQPADAASNCRLGSSSALSRMAHTAPRCWDLFRGRSGGWTTIERRRRR